MSLLVLFPPMAGGVLTAFHHAKIYLFLEYV